MSRLVAASLFLTLGTAYAVPAAAAETPAKASSAKPVSTKKVLPFIEDDWPRALAEAKRRNVPIFIEAWAPW